MRVEVKSGGNRQRVTVGGDEVVGEIEGGERATGAGAACTRTGAAGYVCRIHRFGERGGLIDGLAPGVAGLQVERAGDALGAEFERVIVGVGDGALEIDAAEGGTKGCACALVGGAVGCGVGAALAEGPAGSGAGSDLRWLGKGEAERGVAGVDLLNDEEVVGLGADVA